MNLPEADLPFDGLRGWLLQSKSGQVLFNESDIEFIVPEHIHCAQWGVVIDGEIELTIDNQTGVYGRGDTYYIPGGVTHKARIYPNFKAIDYFSDKKRYKMKTGSKQLLS